MIKRTKKQVLIIAIYLISFLVVLLAAIFLVLPDPDCFDKKQNQGEKGVDCGGPCAPCSQTVKLKPIEVEKVEWIYDEENYYDVVVQIKNPNEIYGAAQFTYTIAAEGGELAGENRNGFILPAETKTIIAHKVQFSAEPTKADININQAGVDWKKFTSYEKPDLIVNNSRYQSGEKIEGELSKALGTVVNQSKIDFETITVKVVLRDREGKLLAANSQAMNTVRADERRDYSIIFSQNLSGSVEKVEVETETNVFDSDNYIQTHGAPEEWEVR